MNGTDFETKLILNSKWVLDRVRRKIPEPSVLVGNLEKLLIMFNTEKWNDGESVLMNKKCIAEFKKMIGHATHGCISDPVRIEMYRAIGKDKKSSRKSYYTLKPYFTYQRCIWSWRLDLTNIYSIVMI